MNAIVQDRYGAADVLQDMTMDTRASEQERRVLRWGGLAGILGGVLFIVVFIFVGAFVGADPAVSEGPITRFPDVRAARTVENSLYLVVLVLWVIHVLALYRALRGTSLAPALFGSVLSILGLVVLAAGALPHVAVVPLSDLYHAPGATAMDQATLVFLWQAIQGVLNELLVVGLLLIPLGVVAQGMAMLAFPPFGKWVGRLSVALGLIGLGAASVVVIDPQSLLAVVGFFALIVFHLVLGWKVYRLSRTPTVSA